MNLDFKDTDQIIEDKLKMTIYDIFQKKGEKYFRSFEEKITLKYLKKTKQLFHWVVEHS